MDLSKDFVLLVFSKMKRENRKRKRMSIFQFIFCFYGIGVYEYTSSEEDGSDEKNTKLVINAQNCVHCKCCSIKSLKNSLICDFKM